MNKIYGILVIVHLIAAVCALIAGVVALFSEPKGSKLHKKAGRIYFYAYMAICVLALAMLILKYKTFLSVDTMLNFYLCFMGYRAVRYKNRIAGIIDWILLIMLGLAATVLALYDWNEPSMWWRLVIWSYFALILYIFVFDLRSFVRKNKDKMSWWFDHMIKMLISFLALITGIAIRTVPRNSPDNIKWIPWLIAYVIGLPLIAFWVAAYKKKFKKQ